MHPITVPLINPNEPEAFLAALHVREGQQVHAGDLIATLETTKAAQDLTAETDGYIVNLRAAEGDTLRAGDVLAYLAESPGDGRRTTDDGRRMTDDGRRTTDDGPRTTDDGQRTTGDGRQTTDDGRRTMDDGRQTTDHGRGATDHGLSPATSTPSGLRITRPALALAREHGLDLEKLPRGPLITQSTVRTLLNAREQPAFAPPETDFDLAAIVIYGAGGHGKSLLDVLRALRHYRILGFVDDGRPAGSEVMGLPLLGGKEALPGLRAQGVRMAVNAVGGIGNIRVRVRVFRILAEAGFVCPPVIHPSAVVEPGAHLEAGVQVMPLAYVGSEAHIGYGALVNTGAIVSHDCRVGAYANLSPGATLAGGVVIGEGVLIGMRATINLGVTVGAGARIGNGATVKSDVPPKGVVRAGGIWPK